MDICYIVGTGSKWANNELKYSLRSIENYGNNVDNVFIVGYKPKFVNDKVIYIPCDDPYTVKHNNILNKVITTINSGLISNRFLISSDDHFYIKEVDFNEIPIYYKNETISGGDKNQYRRSLQETKDFLIENGLTTYQTNPHCNTIFDTSIYNKYKYLFDKGMTLPNGVEMNCLMGNLLIKEGNPFEKYKDIKVLSYRDLKKNIDSTVCFSIYDSAIRLGVGEYLQNKFPNKCKYEID